MILYCQFLPSFYTTSLQDVLPVFGTHAAAESVGTRAFFLFRLVGAFNHRMKILNSKSKAPNKSQIQNARI